MTQLDQFEERVSVNGAELWTTTSGEGSGLVLLHGGPGMSDNLEPLSEMLRDLSTVHRFDQRACGRSNGNSQSQSVESAVDDLELLRIHWNHEKWIVGGHSWGAALSIFYALTYPERVQALLYISGPPFAPLNIKSQAKPRMDRLSELELYEFRSNSNQNDSEAVRRNNHLIWKTDYSDLQKIPDFNVNPTYQYPRNPIVADGLSKSASERISNREIFEEIKQLNFPILIMHGRDDPLPVEGALALSSILRQPTISIIEGVGHLVWKEDEVSTKNILRNFVKSNLI